MCIRNFPFKIEPDLLVNSVTVQTLVKSLLFFISQSTKMILKFRESTISRLDRLRKREKEGSEGQGDEKDREIVSAY